jgi:hypothetical protein
MQGVPGRVHAAGEQEIPTANIRAQLRGAAGSGDIDHPLLDTDESDEQAQEKLLQWRDQESWLVLSTLFPKEYLATVNTPLGSQTRGLWSSNHRAST